MLMLGERLRADEAARIGLIDEAGLRVERAAALAAFTRLEAAEGVSAFLEKQRPKFHANNDA
jgi:enoyl-CoA hydratase/carnithine racemase